jgi:Golgi apyrase
MRLLSPTKQAEILKETCRFLITHSNFKIDGPSAVGPCGSSVRIITGEEEGLFGWIAVNYLMDGFTGSSKERTTYGFLDMGGASTQIAFEPSPAHQGNTKNLIDVRLRLLGGDEIRHKVYVTTWLGYGTNQARERYVGKVVTEFEASRDEEDDNDVVPDPCLPRGLELTESPVHASRPASSHLSATHRLRGTGSFEQCVQKASSLLNKNTPCPDSPCLMNGVHVPPIDFSVSHFIGVSEYWYSSEHIFGLGGAYDFVQYERAASKFCSRDWPGILKEHEESRERHRLGGDGEVEVDGKIVVAGQWGPNVELPRLQMQCFKAAWITNVLHEGIGMPRIVDPGGNSTTDADKVVEEAEKKGLGRPRPTFQSLDSVGDIAISWTLGKMVLEASKEVRPLVKTAKPIVDPIDDIEDIEDSPIQPIRPFFSLDALEDKITPHLPSSLSRSSLGFSPVLFFLYAAIICLLILLCPMRRRRRLSCLRPVRSSVKRDTYSLSETLEEGTANGSIPGSPTLSSQKWTEPLRRIFFAQSKQHSGLSVSTSNNTALRHMTNGHARASPTRSYSMPNDFLSTASSTQHIHGSRSPSPVPGFADDTLASSQSSIMSSRSRNASQMSLTSLASRQNAISRSLSGKGQLQ